MNNRQMSVNSSLKWPPQNSLGNFEQIFVLLCKKGSKKNAGRWLGKEREDLQMPATWNHKGRLTDANLLQER